MSAGSVPNVPIPNSFLRRGIEMTTVAFGSLAVFFFSDFSAPFDFAQPIIELLQEVKSEDVGGEEWRG